MKLLKLQKILYYFYFRLEYRIEAYLFYILKLNGSNFQSRTKNRDINFLKDRLTKNEKKISYLVAFHNPNLIPKSNLNYLNI